MGPGNRPLDLEWLEDFVALASTGSFSRAAEARAIAQPAFSRHIRSLEEWVGVDLFDRSAHPAALTPAGQRFLPLLESVLADLEAARIKSRAAHHLAEASLRFAATHYLSLRFFPHWLTEIESQLGLGSIQTMSDSAHTCEYLMLQRRVQFVLCHGHPQVPGRLDENEYPMVVLGHETLCPVSVPVDGKPGRPALHEIGRGSDVSLLAYGEESGLGRIMRAVLRPRMSALDKQANSEHKEVFTAHHAVLLKTMALEGRGVAWLPRSLMEAELASGTLVPAGAAEWSIPIDIRLYRQKSQMTDKAEALWKVTSSSPLANEVRGVKPS